MHPGLRAGGHDELLRVGGQDVHPSQCCLKLGLRVGVARRRRLALVERVDEARALGGGDVVVHVAPDVDAHLGQQCRVCRLVPHARAGHLDRVVEVGRLPQRDCVCRSALIEGVQVRDGSVNVVCGGPHSIRTVGVGMYVGWLVWSERVCVLVGNIMVLTQHVSDCMHDSSLKSKRTKQKSSRGAKRQRVHRNVRVRVETHPPTFVDVRVPVEDERAMVTAWDLRTAIVAAAAFRGRGRGRSVLSRLLDAEVARDYLVVENGDTCSELAFDECVDDCDFPLSVGGSYGIVRHRHL